MTRLIKRYGNRKLYDTKTSKYVTLDGVAELVRAGDDLRIIDNDTGEDITAVTFAQIIYEEQKKQNGDLGLPALRWIIQQGGAALHEFLAGVDRGREALGSMRELAEKRVKQITRPAAPHKAAAQGADQPGRGLITEILEMPQRQIEQLQHRIDSQVRASIERFTGHPAVRNELRRIERNIKALEKQLRRLGKGTPKPVSRGRARAGRSATD